MTKEEKEYFGETKIKCNKYGHTITAKICFARQKHQYPTGRKAYVPKDIHCEYFCRQGKSVLELFGVEPDPIGDNFYKYCAECKEKKHSTEFYNYLSSKDGKDYYCISCAKKRNKFYVNRKKEREKLIEVLDRM